MALSHQYFDVKGLQFHPESILTPQGGKIIENWIVTDSHTNPSFSHFKSCNTEALTRIVKL